MTTPSTNQAHDDPQRSFIGVIEEIDRATGHAGAPVSAIVGRLDERAFGLLILIFAIPCLVPGLPGAQVIAIPIFLLAAQLVIGRREPWLPGWFMRIQVRKSWITAIATFASKRLRWTERLARPRLQFLASGFGERVAALFMALAAITVMLPITNTIPSLAITLLALGIIQRDGLFTLGGGVLATAWLTLLGVLVASLVLGAGFAVDFAAERAPWLLSLFGR